MKRVNGGGNQRRYSSLYAKSASQRGTKPHRLGMLRGPDFYRGRRASNGDNNKNNSKNGFLSAILFPFKWAYNYSAASKITAIPLMAAGLISLVGIIFKAATVGSIVTGFLPGTLIGLWLIGVGTAATIGYFRPGKRSEKVTLVETSFDKSAKDSETKIPDQEAESYNPFNMIYRWGRRYRGINSIFLAVTTTILGFTAFDAGIFGGALRAFFNSNPYLMMIPAFLTLSMMPMIRAYLFPSKSANEMKGPQSSMRLVFDFIRAKQKRGVAWGMTISWAIANALILGNVLSPGFTNFVGLGWISSLAAFITSSPIAAGMFLFNLYLGWPMMRGLMAKPNMNENDADYKPPLSVYANNVWLGAKSPLVMGTLKTFVYSWLYLPFFILDKTSPMGAFVASHLLNNPFFPFLYTAGLFTLAGDIYGIGWKARDLTFNAKKKYGLHQLMMRAAQYDWSGVLLLHSLGTIYGFSYFWHFFPPPGTFSLPIPGWDFLHKYTNMFAPAFQSWSPGPLSIVATTLFYLFSFLSLAQLSTGIIRFFRRKMGLNPDPFDRGAPPEKKKPPSIDPKREGTIIIKMIRDNDRDDNGGGAPPPADGGGGRPPADGGRGGGAPKGGKPDKGPSKGKGPKDPSKGKGPEDPSKGKGPEDPSKGKGPEDPSKGKGPEDPSKGKGPEDPSKDKGPEDPSKDKGPEDPSKGKGPEDPSKGKGPEDPSKVKGPEDPSKGKGPEDPSKVKGPEDPSKVKGPEDPSKVKGPEDPSKGKGPEDPSKVKGPEDPSKGKGPEDPSKVKGPEDPSKVKGPEDPSKGKGPEDPSKDKSPEDPSKVKGPEDPSKDKSPEDPSKVKGPEDPSKGKGPEDPSKGKGPEDPSKDKGPEDETPNGDGSGPKPKGPDAPANGPGASPITPPDKPPIPIITVRRP